MSSGLNVGVSPQVAREAGLAAHRANVRAYLIAKYGKAISGAAIMEAALREIADSPAEYGQLDSARLRAIAKQALATAKALAEFRPPACHRPALPGQGEAA